MRKCIKNYKCIATRLYNKFFFHRTKDGHHGMVDRLHYMLKNQSLGSLLGKKWQQSLSSHRSVTEAYGVGGTSGKCSHFSCMEKEMKKKWLFLLLNLIRLERCSNLPDIPRITVWHYIIYLSHLNVTRVFKGWGGGF